MERGHQYVKNFITCNKIMWFTLASQIVYLILQVLSELMTSPLGDAFKNWYNKNPLEVKK